MDDKLKKGLYIISGLVFLSMLVVLGVGLSYGEELPYQRMNLTSYAPNGAEKATCLAYHGEVISTYEEYEEFLDVCELIVSFDYDEEYFTSNVVVLYYYDDSSSVRPKTFNNYYFTTENHHIIKIRNYYAPWFLMKKDATPYFYFIEMTRNQITSEDVLFD